MNAREQAIFGRTELLLGEDVMQALSRMKVIIFGVGGVGSWCAEGLVRSGIKHLTIVEQGEHYQCQPAAYGDGQDCRAGQG